MQFSIKFFSTIIRKNSTSNFLLFLTSTDYILSYGIIRLGLPTSTNFGVLPSRGIVVELYFSVLAAGYPLFQHLGFNLMPSSLFFLLSPHSHLYLKIFLRYYVVVKLALGFSSNSSSIGWLSYPSLRIYFYIR